METSSNSSGRHSSDGPCDFRTCCTDQPLSSSALAFPSPVSETRASSPASELRIKVHLSMNDAYTHRLQNIDVQRIGIASTCSDKERHFRTSKSACESFISRERSNDIHRPFHPDREDAAMSTKKSRTDVQIRGGSIPGHTRKLAASEEKTREGWSRLKFFSSCLQAESTQDLLAAKKAEKSSTKSDHCAQQNGDRGRLPARVATRLPHKKAFKTMRFLSEVRDCILEKPAQESHPSAVSRGDLERRSPSKSLQEVEDGKDFQAKRPFVECCGDVHDFPFVVPPILKRARSTRHRRGHQKLTEERHLEDTTIRVEEARGLDVLQVGAKINCKDMGSKVTGQGAINGADASVELPACAEEGTLQEEIEAWPHSVDSERVVVGEPVKGRGAVPLRAEGTSIVKRDGENQHKASIMNVEMAEKVNSRAPEECSEIKRVVIDKERATSKEPLLTVCGNPTDVQCKHMKGLITMENSEQHERAPQLLVNATRNGTNTISHNIDGYVRQGLAEKSPKLGSFQLSLALPGTLMAEAGYALNAHDVVMAPATAIHLPAHSHVQSQTQTQNFSHSHTQTLSDGYTASLSLSPSLFHNPSCSLNCLSVEEQELSCGGTRHTSQFNENVSKRGSLTASANEDDGSFNNLCQDKPKQGHGVPFGQKTLNPFRTLNFSRDDLERQGLKHDNIPGRSFKQEEGAQRPTVAAREAWSKPLAHPASSVGRHSTAKSEGNEGKLGGSFGLQELATEPITLMAQRMQELPDSFLESLRSLARDLLHNFEKRGEFLTLQNIIKNRTDLTENTLLHAQHTLLEILVALRTGEQAFVQVGAKPLTNKVLTEIFLQTRCRNVACQQSLPVDGCECKICFQKSGFCHECMCVVCSKFDSDSQTCRWLGCDFCMHWCHADCGLRMSHIAPAQSNKGAAGNTEMQYRCVACGHSTELFGFVKNAFHLFAENWGAETLTKELDCVRRIFHGSEDVRGRQLSKKVEVSLQKLDMKVDIIEIRCSMLQYFNEADSDSSGACMVANKAVNEKAMVMWEAATQTVPLTENKLADEIKMRQSCERELLLKKFKDTTELHIEQARKKAEIDNIHSMMRLKQAEAKMLQLRADEAQQQARGLQQIISVKQEKIEGDYMSKYAKLRLNEAEEKRSKKFLELQALERAHFDHLGMKLRMEAQIRDLAMKMGRVGWHYA